MPILSNDQGGELICSLMDDIPKDPAGTAFFSSFKTHSFVERDNGVGLVPSNGPLYFALFFYALAPLAWHLTKGLEIDKGLKLAAWLFPLFAATGPLILWGFMIKFFGRFFFDLYRSELILTGFRFTGRKPIPFGDIWGVQTCYGGRKTTRNGRYEKYELNLVLRGGGKISRIHLVGDPDRETIERQAERITARVPIQRFDHMDESIKRWSDNHVY